MTEAHVHGLDPDRLTCSDGEQGKPGGCRSTAVERIVIVHPDGTERPYGAYCSYHAGASRQFWSAQPGDRVEHRAVPSGEVIRSYGLVFR